VPRGLRLVQVFEQKGDPRLAQLEGKLLRHVARDGDVQLLHDRAAVGLGEDGERLKEIPVDDLAIARAVWMAVEHSLPPSRERSTEPRR